MRLIYTLSFHCCIISMLALPLSAYAGLPKSTNVPGGIAIVTLTKKTTTGGKPQAWLEGQEVLVTDYRQQWVAVVGLPLNMQPGLKKLNVKINGSNKTRSFKVITKKYPVQYIKLKDNNKVDLAPADEERAVREIAAIKHLKVNWRDSDYTDLDFMIPAKGRLSGNFGLRRFFNGQARSPHAGLDVAVPSDTPVHASAPGKVLAVEDYFFNGKTIFLDHGNGLITMYCHLNRSEVKTGDSINKGQEIALSGQSGRATGPHLHWSVIMNGAMVDPALFIAGK
jgi:murein DD-endopeptidase MepM/ murein hydrolase activator NlpD